MVEDVIAHCQAALTRLDPQSADDVRNAGETIVAFSPAMRAQEKALKSFLYEKLYRHAEVMRVRAEADGIVTDLFDVYFADPAKMPEGWRDILNRADDGVKARHVADFLAGMTDTYAIKEHQRLFDHTPDLI
jgi:dGTPase